MIGLGNSLAFSLFVPKQGVALAAYMIGSILIGIAFLFMLTRVPQKYRKILIIGATFVAGWFYMLEFFIPGTHDTSLARSRFIAAQRHLQQSAQTLQPLAYPKNELSASQKSGRIATATRELDTAIKDLTEARVSIDKLKPDLNRDLKTANDNANAFSKEHRLTDKMIEPNASTKIIQQHISEIGDSSGQAEGAIAEATAAKNSLSTADSPEEIGAIAANISVAAESAGLAAGAASSNFLTGYKDTIGTVSSVIGGFTLLLGIINLLSIHFKTIAKHKLGWPSSIAFFVAFIAIIVFGMMQTYGRAGGNTKALGSAWYDVLFNGGLAQLQASMFAMVAFYIVSAAYRAFRIRSAEAALMMIAAFLVMLGFVPFGIWLTSGLPASLSFLHLDIIRGWIMEIPNAAAQRGMAFGIGVGALAMGLRIWLSLERGAYFDK